jgi:hypothetical protein
MNYTDLQTEISSILNRGTSLDADIPRWIQAAESLIKSELRDSKSIQFVTDSLSSGTDSITLSSSLLEINSVYLEIGGEYEEVPIVSELPPTDATTGIPSFCTIEGASLRFDVKADQTYPAKYQIYAELDIATTSTNWVSDEVPECYIYGALFYSTAKTKVDTGRYTPFYDIAINTAKRLARKRRGDIKLRTDIPSDYGTFDVVRGY